jgi:hypothetical protein
MKREKTEYTIIKRPRENSQDDGNKPERTVIKLIRLLIVRMNEVSLRNRQSSKSMQARRQVLAGWSEDCW